MYPHLGIYEVFQSDVKKKQLIDVRSYKGFMKLVRMSAKKKWRNLTIPKGETMILIKVIANCLRL